MTKVCSVCKTEQPLTNYYKNTNGWTYKHCKACHADFNRANRIRKRMAQPPKEKVDHGDCTYTPCGRKAVVRLKDGPEGWYCTTHWNQWDKNGELKPIRVLSDSYIDERVRLCTTCKAIKSQHKFYSRTGGRGKQSTCKECQYKAIRFSALLRKDRAEEALSLAETMAESVREKYVARATDAIRESELARSNG